MRNFLRWIGLLAVAPFAFGASETNCGCRCCAGKEVCCCRPAAPSATAAKPGTADKQTEKRHPLRGVIVSVHADTSELRVKHEAIPGVMRAMTMMFKVDAATLHRVKAGQAITALMSRDDGAWWLHDVQVAEAR